MPAFKVSRTPQIKADPETVFNTLSNFSTWETWSPWLLADRNATFTLKGDPSKVGGGFSWDSPIVGAGEMEHLELRPPSESNSIGKIHAQLRFTRPWKSESKVDFEVKPGRDADGGEVTHVRWGMAGSLPFFLLWMKKMMVSLISMDYDRGLRMAKELIETGAIASETVVHGLTEVQPRNVFGVSGRTTLSEIGPAMEKTMGEVMKRLTAAGISTDGEWLALYDDMNIKTQTLDYTCAMVSPDGVSTPSGLMVRSVPGFTAMHVTHTGRYEHMGNAWYAAYQHLQAMKRKPASKLPGLELYANSPENTPAEELVTELYVPVK